MVLQTILKRQFARWKLQVQAIFSSSDAMEWIY